MLIKQAETAAEIGEIKKIFREYEAFLNVDLCFQGFEEELGSLPGKYAPPTGALLIALDGDTAVGCVAVRRLDDSTCEMKRLYVRPQARATGLGRELARRIIREARRLGYLRMRLDTIDRLAEAMGLYRSFGFRTIEPYYHNPLPGVVYWELDLQDPGVGQDSL